jgi:ABC-type uncharacterized transport system YnjBCD permease subunit
MPDPAWERPESVDPYNPDPLREAIRASVTLAALAIFLAVLSYYMVEAAYVPDDRWQRVKEVMAVVLPAVTSILGTALGFYFGSQKS